MSNSRTSQSVTSIRYSPWSVRRALSTGLSSPKTRREFPAKRENNRELQLFVGQPTRKMPKIHQFSTMTVGPRTAKQGILDVRMNNRALHGDDSGDHAERAGHRRRRRVDSLHHLRVR